MKPHRQRVRLNVTISDDLNVRLKVFAAKQHTTIQALAELALDRLIYQLRRGIPRMYQVRDLPKKDGVARA